MKTNKSSITFQEYTKSLDPNYLPTIIELDRLLTKYFENDRSLWSGIFWGGSEQTIIGYGEMSIKNNSEDTWFMIGLSRQKNYYSLYINATIDNQYAVKIFGKKLGKVKLGSSSISFNTLDAVNIEELESLFKIAYDQWKALG